MNVAKECKAIEVALTAYRERLDTIPEELFTETPPGGGWSYAEVYSHILQATLGSSINAERCANGTGEKNSKGSTLLGRLVLLFGRLPAVKVKAPAEVTAKIPAIKISKEDAKNLIIKCRKRIEATTPRIKNASLTSRNKHPRFGMLNAVQWYRFIRIHLQHHLKQLDRIRNKFLAR